MIIWYSPSVTELVLHTGMTETEAQFVKLVWGINQLVDVKPFVSTFAAWLKTISRPASLKMCKREVIAEYLSESKQQKFSVGHIGYDKHSHSVYTIVFPESGNLALVFTGNRMRFMTIEEAKAALVVAND